MNSREYSCIKIISRGLCSLCGACISICPHNAIELYDDIYISYNKCKNCGLCIQVCPSTITPSSLQLTPIAAYSARSTSSTILRNSQDGGVVTSLLSAALNMNIIDCALVTKAKENVIPVPTLATSLEEIIKAAGSKYAYSPILSLIKEVKRSCNSLGIVGLPCHIRALNLIRKRFPSLIEKPRIIISLFCFENFHPKILKSIIRDKLGLSLFNVNKLAIRKGSLIAYTREGVKQSISLKSLSDYVLPVCKLCPEFVSPLSDISVGSIGSPQGWSTVLVWSQRGKELLEHAFKAHYIKIKPLSKKALTLIHELAKIKQKRAEEYAKHIDPQNKIK